MWECSGGNLIIIVEILLARISPQIFSIMSICLLFLQFSERDHQHREYCRQVSTSGKCILPEILTANSYVIFSSDGVGWTIWRLLWHIVLQICVVGYSHDKVASLNHASIFSLFIGWFDLFCFCLFALIALWNTEVNTIPA